MGNIVERGEIFVRSWKNFYPRILNHKRASEGKTIKCHDDAKKKDRNVMKSSSNDVIMLNCRLLYVCMEGKRKPLRLRKFLDMFLNETKLRQSVKWIAVSFLNVRERQRDEIRLLMPVMV